MAYNIMIFLITSQVLLMYVYFRCNFEGSLKDIIQFIRPKQVPHRIYTYILHIILLDSRALRHPHS